MTELPVGEAQDGLETTDSELRRFLGVLRGRSWAIFTCATVVFTLFVVNAFRATPIYEASARLLIERKPPQAALFDTLQEQREEEYHLTQVELITCRAVLERALEDERVATFFADADALDVSRPGLLRTVAHELRRVFGGEPSRPVQPWERLRERIRVEPVEATNLVDVRVRGADPKEAAIIANGVAEAYVRYSVSARKSSALEMFQALQKQKEEQERALVGAEDALQSYQATTGLPHLESAGMKNPAVDRLKALNEEYTAVQLRRIELGVAAEAVEGVLKGDKDVIAALAVQSIAKDAAVQTLCGRLARIELEVKAALNSHYAKHPEVTALEDQRKLVLAQLREAVLRAARSIQRERSMQLRREQELAATLKQQNQVVQESAQKSHRYHRLKREVDRQTRLFDVIVGRMREVDLTKDTGITNNSLVERATAPLTPVSPNKVRAAVLGAILGLLLGIGLGYFLDYFDDTIKTPDDVENRIRMPSLGYVSEIPSSTGNVDGFCERAAYSLKHQGSSVSELFRSIRTKVYFSGEQGQMKSLHITSPAPGDGKTVLAANLAVTLARDNKRVLLVDADLRRPRVHEAFGLRGEPGLANVLVEGKPWREFVQPISGSDNGDGKLHILSAGASSPNPAELLGSRSMKQFMRDAREEYDVVIYDSCPVSFVADNAPLCAAADGTIMVLKAGTTRCDAVKRANRQLQAVNGKIIGAVLSQVSPKILKGDRYSGYYPYYEQYYARRGEGSTGSGGE